MIPTGPDGQQATAYLPELPSEQVSTPRPIPRGLFILVFCLFAGLIAETFVTTSTSPVDILRNPLSLPFNVVLYGTFDLLAREIIVRQRGRLASALLLGAAYGFINEGVAASDELLRLSHTGQGAAYGFINEGVAAGTWYVIHPQGYIFIGRVDWAWALSLTLFHAIISVLVPIAFIEILFPSLRGQSLLPRWGMVTCVVLFLGCVFYAIIVLAPLPLIFFFYRLTVLGVAVLFSLIAWALLARRSAKIAAAPHLNHSAPEAPPTAPQPQSPSARRLPELWRLRILGFLAMFVFFFLNILFPVVVAKLLSSLPGGLVIAQGIDCAMFLAFGALVIGRGWEWSQRVGWSPRQNLALIIGGVTFTTLLLNLTATPMGEVFSTIPFYLLLIALTFRWRRLATAPLATGDKSP